MNNFDELIPIRIQFCCYDKLVAEVIVQGLREASRVCHAYMNLKYNRNKPMGASIRRRADIRRAWNVPVGATIPEFNILKEIV